ncbi:MAG: PilZ domain-containing protein [Treponema sp.]|jgi:hypothetical protein|nr:PilZ domain-containing protein [Treponema sp.]
MREFSIKRLQESLRRQHTGIGKEEQVDNRSYTRYRSFARVKFQGIIGGENLLKDISVTGCRVECTSLSDIQLDTPYVLEIIPEASARIGRFELEVKAVWLSPAGYSGDVGFSIIASPKGKLFQRYVDYLAWQGDRRQKSFSSPLKQDS